MHIFYETIFNVLSDSFLLLFSSQLVQYFIQLFLSFLFFVARLHGFYHVLPEFVFLLSNIGVHNVYTTKSYQKIQWITYIFIHHVCISQSLFLSLSFILYWLLLLYSNISRANEKKKKWKNATHGNCITHFGVVFIFEIIY